MPIKRTLRNFLAGAALTGAALIFAPAPQAHAAVFVSVGIAPPAIPVYEQPLCPGDGYIWTPGYWAWGPDGYYWVDGAWVLPPYEDALWTPGWWGWGDGLYYWHPGYWGRTVGYYGGINYGFGYFGTGFYGGYWNGGHFWYNRAYGHFGDNFHGKFYERREAHFDGHPGGSSFNAHPPAEYGMHNAGFHTSGVNGRDSVRGTEAFPNRGNNGFANREQGFANRGGVNNNSRAPQAFENRSVQNSPAQPSYNRGQSFGGQQPDSDHGRTFENRGNENFGGQFNRAPQPSFNRGPQPNFNRGPEPSFNRGPQPNFNRGPQPSFNRGPEPSFNRAPSAPSGNFNRGGGAPAPQYSAPSGGGSRAGGGGGSHGGGGHR